MIEIVVVVLAVLGGIVFALSMEDAQRRRRAWKLYEAGVIDAVELRKRIN